MTTQLPGFQRQTLGFHSASFGVPPTLHKLASPTVCQYLGAFRATKSVWSRRPTAAILGASDRKSWLAGRANRCKNTGQLREEGGANSKKKQKNNANQQFWLVVLCNVIPKDQVGRLLNNIWCSLKLLYSILCFIWICSVTIKFLIPEMTRCTFSSAFSSTSKERDTNSCSLCDTKGIQQHYFIFIFFIWVGLHFKYMTSLSSFARLW